MARDGQRHDRQAAAAGGIAYRAEQLAEAVALLYGWLPGLDVPPSSKVPVVLRRALVESVLTNARALGYLFAGTDRVRPTTFLGDVDGEAFTREHTPLVDLSKEVVRVVSQHLSHVNLGPRDGNVLPGPWPLVELAVVFVGAVADLHEALDPSRAEWFVPSPRTVNRDLRRWLGSPVPRSPMSTNVSVARLTRRLQEYLEEWPVR